MIGSRRLALSARLWLWLALGLAPLAGCATQTPKPDDLADRPEVQQFINEMVTKHGFDHTQLVKLFEQTRLKPDIIAAISHPAEGRPWFQYRPIFLKPGRIKAGVRYWDAHADDLARAEKIYGVPAKIIVAIIGVETRFGTYKGKYRVMDSLSTLAFDYPKRSAFFRKELQQFLLLTREEHIDPLSLNGSYAGAMGGPQFISSSYRHYAVDFDGDGKRDLWHSDADIIGSVANYFHLHGWQPGQPVARPAQVTGDKYKAIDNGDLKPAYTLQRIHTEFGVSGADGIPTEQKAALISLKGKDETEYWLGMQNFYVITRYNHSALYAMAVYQLANAIAAERQQQRIDVDRADTKMIKP